MDHYVDRYYLENAAEKQFFHDHLATLVASAARFEGMTLGAGKVARILSTGSFAGILPTDIEIVLNLKHAFEYITTLDKLTFDAILRVNELIQGAAKADAGRIRTDIVTVGLTNDTYVPPISSEQTERAFFASLMSADMSATQQAIKLMLHISRSQWFADGNKRTALVVANAIMVTKGVGLLAIPENKIHWYLSQLQKFYLTGRQSAIERWLYEEAIFGIANDATE